MFFSTGVSTSSSRLISSLAGLVANCRWWRRPKMTGRQYWTGWSNAPRWPAQRPVSLLMPGMDEAGAAVERHRFWSYHCALGR